CRESRANEEMDRPAGVKETAEKGRISSEMPEELASGAKARADNAWIMPGINPRPTARSSFSAAWEAGSDFAAFSARLKSWPVTKQDWIRVSRKALMW